MRLAVPIFASEDVLDEASILIPGEEEEEVEKFREFLDKVTPEDFKPGGNSRGERGAGSASGEPRRSAVEEDGDPEIAVVVAVGAEGHAAEALVEDVRSVAGDCMKAFWMLPIVPP